LEGRNLEDSRETRANLLATIERSPDAIGVIRSPGTGFNDLAFTPDGRTLLASGEGGEPEPGLRAYDVATRQPRGFLAGPGQSLAVYSALSADGRLAVVADSPTFYPDYRHFQLYVVDPATMAVVGQPLPAVEPRIDEDEPPPTRLSFSPDKRYVAGVTDIDAGGQVEPPAEALVWDLTRGGGPVLRYHFAASARQREVLFLPDSRSMLVAGTDGTSVVDIASGQFVRRIEGAFAPLALSPDGDTLAATLDPRTAATIGLFDLATGRRTTILAGHSDRITRLDFSPEGATLASAGDDRMVMLWDVASGARLAVLRGHSAAVNALAFSPDGATLASGGADEAVFLWDLRRAVTLAREVPAGVARTPLTISAEFVDASPDGAEVMFIARDFDQFQVREVATGALSPPIEAGGGIMANAQGVGRRYVTVAEPGTIKVWDRQTGGLLAEGRTTLPTEPSWFYAFFTPDGQRLATIYAVVEGGRPNSYLEVLDVGTLQPIGGDPLPLGQLALTAALTPDGNRAVVSLKDLAKVEVIDLAARRVIRSIPFDGAWSTTIGSDGRTLGYGSTDGKVVIIDAVTGEKSPVIKAHDGFVESVSFSPDLASFVTAGRDGTIKLWDTESHQLLGAVAPLGSNRIVQARFVTDARVLIFYATGEVFEWDPTPDAWETYACAVADRNLTKEEWAELFPNRSYRVTCPQYRAGV
jgi:WD40 repeat protein